MARWVVTGASGFLGSDLCAALQRRGHEVVGLYHGHEIGVAGVTPRRIDLRDLSQVAAVVAETRPDVSVHCAAVTDVDACERDEAAALQVNANSAKALARATRDCGGRSVLISTDQLWEGSKTFVGEAEPTQPINAYGRSKARGEESVLAVDPHALVIRTNFFGKGRPWRKGLVDWLVGELDAGRSLPAFSDVYFTPLSVRRLSELIVELVERRASGIFHVAGSERLSKYEFALRIADLLGFDRSLVKRSSLSDVRLLAKRPLEMSLSTEKATSFFGRRMPALRESLEDVRHDFASKISEEPLA